MKKIIPRLFIFLFCVLAALNMQSQSLKNLEANNGFKKYKLGSKFVLGIGIKHKDETGADKVIVDYARESIGDIPVKTIELYYLKDTLSRIEVKISPEYYAKLIEACRNSFGPPTDNESFNENRKSDSTVSVSTYRDDYIWKTNSFRLEYLYTYPKSTGGGYGIKTLQLIYVLNDYGKRQQRANRGVKPASEF